MGTSWYAKVKEFKSPIRVVAAVLLRSRERQTDRVCELSRQITELQSQLDQQQEQFQHQQERIEALQQRAVEAERQRDQARQCITLPEYPPLGTHGYGARMISLAVNLACTVGIRGAARTSAEDVTAWTQEHFPSTVTSRRHATYAEYRSALKGATAEMVAL